MKKEKKEYEAPKAEEVQMVSSEMLESTQKALLTATDTINKLKEDSIANNDKYLRALADYQNLKRISDMKISNAKNSGKISVFKDLIPVIDNFDKAIEAGEVTEGVQLIYNNLISVLKNNNVEIINPSIGEAFNDTIHEAVAPVVIQNEIQEKNTIAFTQLKGYKLGDTVIRYAKVGIYVDIG